MRTREELAQLIAENEAESTFINTRDWELNNKAYTIRLNHLYSEMVKLKSEMDHYIALDILEKDRDQFEHDCKDYNNFPIGECSIAPHRLKDHQQLKTLAKCELSVISCANGIAQVQVTKGTSFLVGMIYSLSTINLCQKIDETPIPSFSKHHKSFLSKVRDMDGTTIKNNVAYTTNGHIVIREILDGNNPDSDTETTYRMGMMDKFFEYPVISSFNLDKKEILSRLSKKPGAIIDLDFTNKKLIIQGDKWNYAIEKRNGSYATDKQVYAEITFPLTITNEKNLISEVLRVNGDYLKYCVDAMHENSVNVDIISFSGYYAIVFKSEKINTLLAVIKRKA